MSLDLRSPVPRMTRAESWSVVLATLVVAASRIVFRARSPWDWDEILFALAMHDYDVPSHHPHPPGFPLFVGAAKLIASAGVSHFRSLQCLTLIAGAALVPAFVFFARELRFRFATAMSAALLFAFLPNVWFFGETAFSDVPSVVLVVLACGLLLRGCRSGTAYVAGAIVLAVAAGFRPQNLVIGLVPALIATWCQWRQRNFARIAVAIVVPAAILAASYAAAAHASGGWAIYREAITAHEKYIRTVDSFRSPTRPPLTHLVDEFFVRPFRAPIINSVVAILSALALLGALLRRGRAWPVAIATASFGPFATAAWLLLDHMSASRFSIGYSPLFAILAAEGIAVVASMARSPRVRWWIETSLAAGGIVTMIAWTLPAVDRARREVSPPIAAVNWVRASLPAGSPIYVDGSMGPFAELLLRDYRVHWLSGVPPVARLESEPAWALAESLSAIPGAQNFSWPRTRLWNLVRHRYFEASVAPILQRVWFLEGWYDEESDGRTSWRWMGARSVTELPAIAVRARLTIRVFVPIHAMALPPELTFTLDGRLLDRLTAAEPYIERTFDVPARADARRLVVETSRVVNQAREGTGSDPRDLGLRVDRLEWTAITD